MKTLALLLSILLIQGMLQATYALLVPGDSNWNLEVSSDAELQEWIAELDRDSTRFEALGKLIRNSNTLPRSTGSMIIFHGDKVRERRVGLADAAIARYADDEEILEQCLKPNCLLAQQYWALNCVHHFWFGHNPDPTTKPHYERVPQVQFLAHDSPSEDVRYAAQRALMGLGDQRDWLQRCEAEETSPTNIMRLVGHRDHDRMHQHLVRLLGHPDSDVRRKALDFIADDGHRAEMLRYPYDPQLFSLSEALITDGEPRIRQAALGALRTMKHFHPEIYRKHFLRMSEDPSPVVRRFVALRLRDFAPAAEGAPGYRPLALQLASDPDDRTALAAIRWLGAKGYEDRLKAIARDEAHSEWTRNDARWLLK